MQQIPFTQCVFKQQFPGTVILDSDDNVVPGVSYIKNYTGLITGKKYTGFYCKTMNHLFLHDGSTVGVGQHCTTDYLPFIPFPDQKVLIWNIWRNGSSTIIRTRAALDGVNFEAGEPSMCHFLQPYGYKYEHVFAEYDLNKYRDYKHVAFVQNGEERFIKLTDYWYRTYPFTKYGNDYLPPIKHDIKDNSIDAVVEWQCCLGYFNSFSTSNEYEQHMWPQYKYLECMPLLDLVVDLKDMTSFFEDEMGIPCKNANVESKPPVITRESFNEELQTLIAHIYQKDNEIVIGEHKRADADEEEEDEEEKS